MQKPEFVELLEAAIRAAKSVRGVAKSPEVSRFVDVVNRLKQAPVSFICGVLSTANFGKSLDLFMTHKNPQIRCEGRLLWNRWLQILYASGREEHGAKKTPVKIQTGSTNKTGDSTRDKVREILQTSLAKVATEVVEKEMKTIVSGCDPLVVAVSVESAMFEKLGCFLGPQKAKYRSILFNLRDNNNPDLRRKVLTGEINGERLVTMKTEDMGSDKLQKEVQQFREKSRLKEENRLKMFQQSSDLIIT